MTPPPLPLPNRIPPAADESLASYLDRVAAFHHTPLQTILARVTVVDRDHNLSTANGYGITLPPEVVQAIADTLWLEAEQVDGMLLASYDGTAIDLSELDALDAATLGRTASRTWAYFAGSHLCPACIADHDGAWKLRWKLPWSFACTDHRVMLADTCPECVNRLGVTRRDGRVSPGFTGRTPRPGLCASPMPSGFAGAGRSAVQCGHPLAAIPTPTIKASSPLLEVQAAIDGVLDGGSCRVGGESVTALEWFSDLRSLCALLLYAAEPDDLTRDHDTPDIVCAAFVDHVQRRNAVIRDRAEHVEAGGDARRGPRLRTYAAAPTSASLMAAIVPTAASIATAPTPGALADALDRFVYRAGELAPRQAPTLHSRFRFSPRLRTAWQTCRTRQRGKFVHRTGIAVNTPRKYGFRSDHVPQLLWADEYRTRFAELLVGKHEYRGRRYCSMALVKLTGSYTWRQVGALLGLDEDDAQDLANQCVWDLNRSGNSEGFNQQLHALARRLDGEENLVDYAARRRAFADLMAIPDDVWKSMCFNAGVNAGQGAKQYNAGIWLWCELTGGDFRLAPSFRDYDKPEERELYLRFTKRLPDDLKQRLREYGDRLLREAGLFETDPSRAA